MLATVRLLQIRMVVMVVHTSVRMRVATVVDITSLARAAGGGGRVGVAKAMQNVDGDLRMEYPVHMLFSQFTVLAPEINQPCTFRCP